jgi:hypothetical protein
MVEKLKELKRVSEELKIVRDRFTKLKEQYSTFVETAKKETQSNVLLSVKVLEGDSNATFIEYLDRRAQLVFAFDRVDAQGYVRAYDVTPPPCEFGRIDEHAKPFFTFSFDSSGMTNLQPVGLTNAVPSLSNENDVLCIMLNIVDALLKKSRPV